ncbi:hypothetical protein Sste5346_000340 [Sporothrix stenoceras]|uniref:BTB domain-containing protein n=1 Tax=Sporothrix stenoceras TaxID=5173 RepID=A0ABR3ZSA8_9PEZI
MVKKAKGSKKWRPSRKLDSSTDGAQSGGNWREKSEDSEDDDDTSESNDKPTATSPPPSLQQHPVQLTPSLPALPQTPSPTKPAIEDKQEQEQPSDNERTPTERQYTHDGWNVKVVCNSVEWHLHKVILRKCQYFSAFLPVAEVDDGSICVIELHNHCPGQLSSILRFMYFFEYPGAEYDPYQPLYGDSLLTNTAMFVAGVSVGHQGMMQYALKHIIKWTNTVLLGSGSTEEAEGEERTATPMSSRDSPLGLAIWSSGQMDYAILRLAEPLLRSLTIVYEQPLAVRAGPLYKLRLILVRFVAAALPFLAVNAAFRAHFRNEWERPLVLSPLDERPPGRTVIEDIVVDYAMFSDLGRIGWRKVTVGAGVTAHMKKIHQPSLSRTFALLQRLSQNERSWTTAAPNARDNKDSGSDDRTTMPKPETRAEGKAKRKGESKPKDGGGEKSWETNLVDHEQIMGELWQGLDALLASEMST